MDIREREFELRDNGSLVFDGIVVGTTSDAEHEPDEDGPVEVERATITIDLGWAKAAGVRVRVLDDPAVDRHRGGVALDR